jgi:hypothetical protein
MGRWRVAVCVLAVAMAAVGCGSSDDEGSPFGSSTTAAETDSESGQRARATLDEWFNDDLFYAIDQIETLDSDLDECDDLSSPADCAELNSVEISGAGVHADNIARELDKVADEVPNRPSDLTDLETEVRSKLTALTAAIERLDEVCASSYADPGCAAAVDDFHLQLAAVQGPIADLRIEITLPSG